MDELSSSVNIFRQSIGNKLEEDQASQVPTDLGTRDMVITSISGLLILAALLLGCRGQMLVKKMKSTRNEDLRKELDVFCIYNLWAVRLSQIVAVFGISLGAMHLLLSQEVTR